ncbi:MAG: DUF4012 domain-containing protein [Actinomycetota bacterium]
MGVVSASRARSVILWALIVVGALLLLDGAYVALRLRSSLQGADGALEKGVGAVVQGDLAASAERFTEALAAARDARDLRRHPAFQVGLRLPFVGSDVQAARAMADAAAWGARAGLEVVAGAREAGADAGLVAALYRDGRARFDAMDAMEPALAGAEGLLASADDRLDEVPEPTVPFIREALAGARRRLDGARDATRSGGIVLAALPSILAENGERRYLLAFQSPSEARAGGGISGVYGTLDVSDGRVSVGHIGTIGELVLDPSEAVEAPSWYRRRYEAFASLWQWQQANFSPDFPVVSQVWLRMYEAARGERLDGVIAMDPIALGYLTAATGPLRAQGMDVDVGPDNAARVLLHDSYVTFDGRGGAQNRYISDLTRQFWERFSRGEADAATMVSALGQAFGTQHLKMYAADVGAQEALQELDADGGLDADVPNQQLLFHNNTAANKIDYFLRRTIDTTVRLTQQGDASVIATASLENLAPPGPPSLLLGPTIEGDVAGVNRMMLNFLLPQGAEPEAFLLDGEQLPILTDDEGGFPVVWNIIEVAPESTVEVSVAYTISEAFEPSDRGGEFTMTLSPQATVVPDRFTLTVVPPFQSSLVESSTGAAEDGLLRVSGTLTEPRTIVARYALE